MRGSALPALLAPLPGADVAPAAPLAGPPLPPAGDLLAGLPVVLEKHVKKNRHVTLSVRLDEKYRFFYLPRLPYLRSEFNDIH